MRRSAASALALALLALAAPAQLARELDLALARALATGAVPGAVVAVGRGDEVLFERAFGARALEPREEATVDTLYDLASLTKPIATASSVLKLVERGALELDAPVARHLTEFGSRGKDAITVEMLLLHTSGLVADNPLDDYVGARAQMWTRICELAPRQTPGTKFTYSDVGYIVLGELVARVDGRPLDAFARAELFEPLGMLDTLFTPPPELAPRCAPTEQRGGRWMRGEVHDPRAFALGGVAGHAGLFSTAADVSRWCRMLLAGGELDGVRVLETRTVEALLSPRTLPGGGLRTLALDCDTELSLARGSVFTRGTTFGHTGFTGTSLWLDPSTMGYVLALCNRVHPAGAGDTRELRRAVADAAARALHASEGVLTGADVLAREGCARLAGRKVALLTNRTGRLKSGERTIDLLARTPGVLLRSLLAPEHGLGARAEGSIENEIDPATGLVIHSLYGATRRPTPEMLAGCDTLVVDLQHVGTRIYTYESTLAYALEVAGSLGVRVVVLDRPDPLALLAAQGPLADAQRLDFTSHRALPLAHGLTLGERARLEREHFGVACELEVIACEGWRRSMRWAQTGLEWQDPSPNLRNETQVLLYPGIALLEPTNVSVGRGTDEPFERLGAPWIEPLALARALDALELPGLEFTPLRFTPSASTFANEACGGVHITVGRREAVRVVEAGLAIARTLRDLYGERFEFERIDRLLRDRETLALLSSGARIADIAASWSGDLAAFEALAAKVRLYEP
ncbi:MAG: DUF1343 domain-containing protein [Planctomycetes bacterium]|nr:DUF1343 domain-containing protein [Planctomycetota bacterium]